MNYVETMVELNHECSHESGKLKTKTAYNSLESNRLSNETVEIDIQTFVDNSKACLDHVGLEKRKPEGSPHELLDIQSDSGNCKQFHRKSLWWINSVL